MGHKVFKAVIIDDEQASIDLLSLLIKEECPEISIVSKCTGPSEGIRAIRENIPDVVFLDIEMPEMNGLQLIQNVGNVSFYPVFTTAYSQYAINAIKLGAFDYLLKPLRRDELKALVDRMHEHSSQSKQFMTPEVLQEMIKNIDILNPKPTRITVQEGDRFHFLKLHEIQYLQAQGNYTQFVLTDGRTILVAKTLRIFSDLLEPHGFVRSHASYVVNIHMVNTFIKGTLNSVIMQNGNTLPVSRQRKMALLSRI